MRTICLDVGCGDNVKYRFNPRCSKIHESIFLDVGFPTHDVKMLIVNMSSAHFVVASVERLPIRDHSVDVVYAFHVLEHVQNILSACCEIVRVLKSGGHANIAVPNFMSVNARRDPSHVHVLDIFKLRKLLRRAGCRHVVPVSRAGSRLPRILWLLVSILFLLLCEELNVICIR